MLEKKAISPNVSDSKVRQQSHRSPDLALIAYREVRNELNARAFCLGDGDAYRRLPITFPFVRKGHITKLVDPPKFFVLRKKCEFGAAA